MVAAFRVASFARIIELNSIRISGSRPEGVGTLAGPAKVQSSPMFQLLAREARVEEVLDGPKRGAMLLLALVIESKFRPQSSC